MSWIFITLVLTVVSGGCCNESAGCDGSQAVLIASADNGVFAVVTPLGVPAAPAIFHHTDLSFNFMPVPSLTVAPEFVPLLRSRCVPSRFSGTSPPIV